MKIRILSLGDIVTPDMMEGVKALSEKTGLLPKRILQILQEEDINKLINQFKLGYVGALGEDDLPAHEFAQKFASKLVARLNIEAPDLITEDDFFDALMMNPKYEADDQTKTLVYRAILDEAIVFNNTPSCLLIILGHTNFIDILCMWGNGVDVNPFDPHSICGIPFYASYNRHALAPVLLEGILRELREEQERQVEKQKDNNIYKLFQVPQPALCPDIAWVYTDPSGGADHFETPPDAMYAVCEQFGIRTQFWDKASKESLTTALTRESAARGLRPAGAN